MTRQSNKFGWGTTLRTGLIFGLVALFLALVGLVGAFSERDLVFNVISLGQTWLLIVGLATGYVIGNRSEDRPTQTALLHSAVAGLAAGAVLTAFIVLASHVNLREIFVNASGELLDLLAFGQGVVLGGILQVIVGGVLGLLGGFASHLQPDVRKPVVTGLLVVLIIGIMQDLLGVLLTSSGLKFLARLLFGRSGLSIIGTIIVFALGAGFSAGQPFIKQTTAPFAGWINDPKRRVVKASGTGIITIALLLALPWIIKIYFSDVIDNVGLYILMGLGLNIVVGFAGLLDLGYVAFFAIGAYTMGLLTSPASILGWEWSFWAALPFSMAAAGLAGILLGVPVLRMRGDYLAIVTLGFGEIIRILATSDLLKPYIGGAQGILQIPKPTIFGVNLINSQHLYYIILVGCLLALYASWRLSESRVGRTWIAIREDEDVAQAMGIDLVRYKLLAFAIGATFSGLAGGVFASKLSSIFPHSFNLLISINVLCLIIVGGMASLPGVIVGALILVGLPELLREFAEFRLLMYGALLVVMMLLRPEGFWPAQQRRRELHEESMTPEHV
jgi:branched-chain amino acid transport system permease protein